MIEHITHKVCPDCGSSVKAEGKYDQHTNGNWNEVREFKCGAIYQFSPNFMTVDQKKLCSKTEAAKKIEADRISAKDKIKAVIESLEVDIEFKNKLVASMQYVLIN